MSLVADIAAKFGAAPEVGIAGLPSPSADAQAILHSQGPMVRAL